jgi:hypothetical protein
MEALIFTFIFSHFSRKAKNFSEDVNLNIFQGKPQFFKENHNFSLKILIWTIVHLLIRFLDRDGQAGRTSAARRDQEEAAEGDGQQAPARKIRDPQQEEEHGRNCRISVVGIRHGTDVRSVCSDLVKIQFLFNPPNLSYPNLVDGKTWKKEFLKIWAGQTWW